MQFSSDDVKLLVEVATPIFAAVWYLRGTLVKLDATLTSLGGRVKNVETDVQDLQDWRLRYVETHAAPPTVQRIR